MEMLLLPLVIVIIIVSTIGGITYAYFTANANNNNVIKGNTASVSLGLNVNLISTKTTNNLIPLDNDTVSLTKAAKGYNNTGGFNGNLACIDKNGYSSCQIYQVDVTNNSSATLELSGGVTSLSGANTPNLACAIMASSTSVTSNRTCIGSSTIASNVKFNANETKSYYILVYINNLNSPQTDKGDYSGTVEFSALGGRVTAHFES